jgi:predicted DNA-binding transcriptional regulator YafY
MRLDTAIEILYTNYRGETARRKIIPSSLRFGATEYHPQPQWLLDAFDLEKQADRTFAVLDIQEWKAI